jgi:hypothetical protein
MGLPGDARNFGQPLRAGATDCVRTGAVFAASIGAALLEIVGFGDAAVVGCGAGAPAFFGGGAVSCFEGGAISCFDDSTAGLVGTLTEAAAVAVAGGVGALGSRCGEPLIFGATASVKTGAAITAGFGAAFLGEGLLLNLTTSVRTGATLAIENGGAIFNSNGFSAGAGLELGTGATGAAGCF